MRAALALRVALCAALSAFTATPARAEQNVRGEGVVVHYSAVNTTALPAEVARTLGVRARESHALILLSPRREADPAQSVMAQAGGVVRRLTGQRQALAFRTVQNGTQHDLIAEFEIQDGERLAFDLSVRPEGAAYPLVIRFQQQFYRE